MMGMFGGPQEPYRLSRDGGGWRASLTVHENGKTTSHMAWAKTPAEAIVAVDRMETEWNRPQGCRFGCCPGCYK